MAAMNIYLKIKALAKRQPLIERVPFSIDDNVTLSTSNSLVEYIVRRNVDDYNNKAVDAPLFPYLTDDMLANNVKTGKTGFNDRRNAKAQDADEAVQNALTCFNDGLFRLFINDTETGYGENITLTDGDEITFIRLTMLAGQCFANEQ